MLIPSRFSRFPAVRTRIFLCLLAVFSALPAVAVTQQPDTVRVDRIVAIVNDEAITESDLARRTREVRTRLSQQNLNFPPESVFRQQVLESLVMERVQLQLARVLNIKVSPDRVEQTIADLAQRRGMSVPAFLAEASRSGASAESLRDDLRGQLLIQQLLDREVRDRVSVTEREVANFLTRRSVADDVAYDFSHILIALPEHASPAVVTATGRRTAELRARLVSGADFAQAAVAQSQGPTALSGGKMGWKAAGQLPDLFLDALESLQPDGVSDVLRGSNGFHLIKLNDKRGGDSGAPVTEVHARQILIRPSEILSTEAALARIRQLRTRIEQGQDFADLARSNSDDIISAREGGDLGWIAPQQMPPEFDRAVADMAPMALSMPFRTAAGFHLVQVLERRTRDISAERQAARARNQIHARKSEERYEQWLRELRDSAYVEFRADSKQ